MTTNLNPNRRAVLDVGSNSVLLTVAEKSGDTWVQILEDTAVTALGQGTKTTGLLGEPGMSSSIRAIKEFFELAQAQNARVVAAATMAARIASNTSEFLERCKSQGTPVSILSGEDEAQLGFDSVATDPIFSQYQRLSIIDPGGQSTEIITADRTAIGFDVNFRKSFPIGTLGIKSTLLPQESIDSISVLRAIGAIDDSIGLRYRPNQAGHAVVLGATGTNLISIREKLQKWNPKLVHGAWLDYEEVSKSVGWMMGMTDAERASIPGMEPGREKTIHLGALILERFLFALAAEGCSVSVRGWRHALLENDIRFEKEWSSANMI